MERDGSASDRTIPGRAVAPGITLPEILIALSLLALLTAAALQGFNALDHISLARSADLVQGHLARARLEALARRERVEVRSAAGGRLLIVDARGRVLERLDPAGDGLLRLDSVRVRPAVIRYNPRGQGSPGSIYLFRGHNGIRLVSNFIGRVRRHAFRF
ncbi:MAG: GspH/FimT family pseudopilin [Gemmatimonadota bacterium]